MITATYDPEQWQLVPRSSTLEMDRELVWGGDSGEEKWTAALATAPQHESQWQPIETAPKDADTRILGLSKQGSMYVICYDDIFSAPWRVLNHEGFNEGVFTHWMPLPQHPDTGETTQKEIL